MGLIMGSQNIMGSDYGSNISGNNIHKGQLCWRTTNVPKKNARRLTYYTERSHILHKRTSLA